MLTRTFTNYQKITEFTSTDNEAGPNAFDGEGVPYKGKLIGMEDVPTDRDEKTCLDLILRLKTVVRARGEHKQKIQFYLSLDGIKIIDELTKIELACHEISRIPFVILDPRDIRTFGYVYNTSDERHQFWAIKTERPAQSAILAIKDLFDEAYRHKLSLENGNGEADQVIYTLPSIEEMTAPIQTSSSEFPLQSLKSAPLTTQQPTTSVSDNVWGDNLSATVSLPTEISQQQPGFNDDPWGFNTPVVPVEQSTPRVADSSISVFLLPPPPVSSSRRMTTTQQPVSTADTGDLFSVFTTVLPTSSVNNNGFIPSTQEMPSASQEEANLFDSMPNSSTTATSSFDDFDLLSDFSSQSTAVKPTNELFFPL